MSDKDFENFLKTVDNNPNVESENDFHEFIKVVGKFLLVFFCCFLVVKFGLNGYVENMNPETRVKIENALTDKNSINILTNHKYDKTLDYANKIKDYIIKNDAKLKIRNDYPINIVNDASFNAFILPNGEIYFTEGLIKKVDEQELTFVLAHELGHYSNKHQLRQMSNSVAMTLVASVLSLGSDVRFSNFTKNLSGATMIKYSQDQEEEADFYANNIIISIYGNNDAAMRLFEKLKKEAEAPEFLYFLSTHPSPSSRMNFLKAHAR